MTRYSFPILLVCCCIILMACQNGVTGNYSNLPRSNLITPTHIVDGSAIAIHGKSNCARLWIKLAPELEPRKYGEARNIIFSSVEPRRLDNLMYHMDGQKLALIELPPGKYAIASLKCEDDTLYLQTPATKPVKYGEFNVVPGAITYLGNLTVHASFDRKKFSFELKDHTEQARADVYEKYPDRRDDFRVGLLENVIDYEQSMKALQALAERL